MAGAKDMANRNKALNRGILKVKSVGRVLQIVDSRVNEFNVVNATTCLRQIILLGGCSIIDPAFFKLLGRLAELLSENEPEVEARTIATLLHALAKAVPPQIVQRLRGQGGVQ